MFLETLFQLKDKCVVLTGASGQLGHVLADAFLQAGARVIGLDINSDTNTIEGVDYYAVDIRKKSEVISAFKYAVKKLGAVDVLINNAGVSTFTAVENRSEDEFDYVTNVNLKGTFFCTQAYMHMIDAHGWKSGVIVNIASVYGMVSPDFRIYPGDTHKSPEIYGATKAGVIQMTKYFAVYLAARNIRVNAISPGGFYNPKSPQEKDFIERYSSRCPMGRMGNESEIAGAALFLSSDAASYITGHNLVIDGGFSSW